MSTAIEQDQHVISDDEVREGHFENESYQHAPTDALEPRAASPCARTWDYERIARGEFIAMGTSGFVELNADGHIIKSPNVDYLDECRHELRLEAKIYEHLGPHPRLVRILNWDAQLDTLTMEYMRRGTLKDYLAQLDKSVEISRAQRLQWAIECAQGMEFLHSRGVWHCDFKAKNVLLDDTGGVRIIDFGGSSLHGSMPSAHPGCRFAPTADVYAFGLRQELFALGSLMYTIMMGVEPYEDINSDEVRQHYDQQQFPDVTGLEEGRLIKNCWLGTARSAEEIRESLEELLRRYNSDKIPTAEPNEKARTRESRSRFHKLWRTMKSCFH